MADVKHGGSKLYTIECEGHGGSVIEPVYYVGKTTQPLEVRFQQHAEQQDGSKWTGLHKPIRFVPNAGPATLDPDDKFSEDTLVYRTMEVHGIENVRGGMYSQIRLSEEQINEISKKLTAATDRCYRCNQAGHFVKNCPRNPPTVLPDENSNTNNLLSHAIGAGSVLLNTATAVAASIAHGLFGKKPPQYGKLTSKPYRSNSLPYAKKFPKALSKPSSRVCYRCGRTSHLAPDCHAKSHINGQQL